MIKNRMMASLTIILYQGGEGCYKSRLVREALCSLEIPYLSIPSMVTGTCHKLPTELLSSSSVSSIPILVDKNNSCDR